MAVSLAFLNLGPEEFTAILLLYLLFFGAEKAPQLARQLGRVRANLARVQAEAQQALRSPEDAALEEQLRFEEMRERHIAQQDTEMFQLRRAAEELGIDATGKSREELRAAIAARVAEPALEEKVSEKAASAQQSPYPRQDEGPGRST